MVDEDDLAILSLEWQHSIVTPFAFNVWSDSSNEIMLSWDDEVTGESHWEVWRSTDGVNFGASPLATVAGDGAADKAYTDAPLSPQTACWYRVRAVVSGVPQTFSAKKWAVTQPAIDLDVFEDSNQDFVHDNTYAAEVLEATQPTELPYMEEDGDYEELALTVNDAMPGATVTFTFDDSQLQLYRDIMGLNAIGSGQGIDLSVFGISGSGTVSVFAKLLTTTPSLQEPAIEAQLGNGSTGQTQAFRGRFARRLGNDPHRPDDPTLHDGDPNNDVWGGGGLDDGDGPTGDPLTDRDGFWTTHAGATTLIIGFAGHTQSRGTHGIGGQIWSIFDVGARTIGQQIRDTFGQLANPWAVTMFPEDPGNDNFAVRLRCGDGVLGRANPYHGDARVDAHGNPTGALAFLIDAIMNRGVTRVGLFGYSHGGGSVQMLMEALASEAGRLPALRERLLTGLGAPRVNFFWTAYIDAIHIDLEVLGGGLFEAIGAPVAEARYPIEPIPDSPYLSIGTWWHYNAYQQWTLLFRDGVPLGGTELDEDEWFELGRDRDFVRQNYAEPAGGWPLGTDHTSRVDRRGRIRGRGIAEDVAVQSLLTTSLTQAYIDTWGTWP
ncbi:hypothetical protein [Fontivita pretiosa]|uniref:hypothetical protein n=1 Tax=Fontivita pretiosa TaxID=2989684 RepID=UPI003D17E5EA